MPNERLVELIAQVMMDASTTTVYELACAIADAVERDYASVQTIEVQVNHGEKEG